MPAFRIASASRRVPVLVLALVALSIGAAPAAAAEPPASKVENSNLDASLFYQLLLSEIELRSDQAGTAYQRMLDAARRSKDEQLFRRATEMALQARAGDQALSAVLAWRQALPDSADALRYQIQILIALNRIGDAEEPHGVIVARGGSLENGATNFYALHQDAESMTENVSQAFLGLSIGCAKCHNHPLEKWTNDQYYAMANLFARVRAKGWGGEPRNGDGSRTLRQGVTRTASVVPRIPMTAAGVSRRMTSGASLAIRPET